MFGLTWLSPGALTLGAAVAGALAVLHAITVGRPRPAWLPTARFAPARAPRAERRLAQPTDRWLLALRTVAALLAAAALARPVREPVRRRVARVVLADLSDSGVRATVRDSARSLAGAGDALVAFAGTPRPALMVPRNAGTNTGGSTPADSAAVRRSVDSALATVPVTDARASLSAALIAARRVAPSLAADADSIEVLVVSPFARDAVDAATLAIRGTWNGRIRLVVVRGTRTPAAASPAPAGHSTVSLRGAPESDALAAALSLAGVMQTDSASVRVLRAVPTPADRAWASDRGHVLVLWPVGGGEDRGPQALAIDARAAVGPFGRVVLDTLPRPREAPGALPGAAGRIVARWTDGTAAAVERRTAAGGCVRTIGARIPQAGDAALRPDLIGLLPTLLGPCRTLRDSAPLAPVDLVRIAGTGPLLAAAPLRAPSSSHHPDPLGAALLAVSALLVAGEWPLRHFTRWSTAEAAADRAGPDDGAPERASSSGRPTSARPVDPNRAVA